MREFRLIISILNEQCVKPLVVIGQIKKLIKRTVGLLIGTGLIYLSILVYPNFLFANHYEYKSYQIYSDGPINENIKSVIDDAIRRIEKSELYNTNSKFNLYLCNADWRFKFFTRNGNAGGIVNFMISGNIFIRENDIENNQIIPPDTWINLLKDRPLSYFIAHESIHSLQRAYNKFLILKVPTEIIEGYAEYIAKRETKDMKSLIEDYKNNSSTMNPSNGLYDKYNLYVCYLIEGKGFNFEEIVVKQPDIEETLKELLQNSILPQT